MRVQELVKELEQSLMQMIFIGEKKNATNSTTEVSRLIKQQYKDKITHFLTLLVVESFHSFFSMTRLFSSMFQVVLA